MMPLTGLVRQVSIIRIPRLVGTAPDEGMAGIVAGAGELVDGAVEEP